jgi:hypothetical protein
MPEKRLFIATSEDRTAKLDAFEAGLAAPSRLSEPQLAHLCMLGERMMHTALRKSDAERDVLEATVQIPRAVDVLLPV